MNLVNFNRDSKFIMDEHLLCKITEDPRKSPSSYSIEPSKFSTFNSRPTRRSYSAPSIFTEIKNQTPKSDQFKPNLLSTPSIVKQAFIGVLLYISVGIIVYVAKPKSFNGTTTYRPIDAAYFSVVTLCTIGYGDITPSTNFTKIFTSIFILVGFGFIDILLNGLVTYILDSQEAMMMSTVDERCQTAMFKAYLVDFDKGRMRVRMKVGLAVMVVIVCLSVGVFMAHILEGLGWIDSFYLTVVSVATVGYGDYSFKTLKGRFFASIWLLVSTVAVARAFLYLTELRIERRNREIAKWVLQKKMTPGDLISADLDQKGSVSKSEYVIYKLKEMGKVAENDIFQICKQFDRLDTSNCGKITLSDLIANHH